MGAIGGLALGIGSSLLGGGGGSNETTASRSLSPQAQALWDSYVTPYAEKGSGLATNFLDTASNLAQNNYGLQNLDYSGMNDTAQSQIAQGNSNLTSLGNGQLTDEQTKNFQDYLNQATKSAVGDTLNSLSSRGVLNSSVTNKAINDVEQNVANAANSNYQQTLGNLSSINSNSIGNAAANIGTAAAAQSAATQPLANALNFSTNLQNAAVTSPLSAISGTGTTTSSKGSDNVWSSLMGLGSQYLLGTAKV